QSLSPAIPTRGRIHEPARSKRYRRRPRPAGRIHLVQGSRGNRTNTVVPPDGGQSITIWPSCASTNRLAVGRPRPEPRDFVVKNGVKIFSRTSEGMPGPVSVKA